MTASALPGESEREPIVKGCARRSSQASMSAAFARTLARPREREPHRRVACPMAPACATGQVGVGARDAISRKGRPHLAVRSGPMPDSEETRGYAGFAFLLHPPLWCGDEPAERTKEALTESVWRSRLQIGVEISVTREGLVLIDFGGWHETSKAEAVRDNDVDAMVEMDERRVAVGNAFLACLHTALLAEQKMGHRAQVITPAEVAHVTDIGLPDGTVFFFDERPLTVLVSAALGGAALDDEKARMLIVERATLDVASGLLDELLGSRAIDGSRTAALLLRAAKAAEDEEYGLALIIAWSLSEQMLNARWVKYLV